MLAGCRTQHAESGFNRRGARVIQLKSVQITRQNLGQFFHEQRFDGRSEVVRVHQRTGRLLNRLGDLRMAVAEGGDVDTG